MTAIEQALKDAEGAGYAEYHICGHGSPYAQVFLDPAFWHAYAKAKGWNDHVNNKTDAKILGKYGSESRLQWHRLIDRLAEGKDAESFFQSL